MGLEWDKMGLYNQQYTNNSSVPISQPKKEKSIKIHQVSHWSG